MMEEKEESMNREIAFLLKDFLPQLFQPREVKLALLLQVISPEPIHILLFGEPATGKTTVLKEIAKLKEKVVYFNCMPCADYSSSNIPPKEILAGQEFLCLDNLEQAPEEDQFILAESMNSERTVLAAASPKYGGFNPYKHLANQAKLISRLLSSFDLVFPLIDLTNKEKDLEKVHEFLNPRPSFLPEDVRRPAKKKIVISPEIMLRIEEFYAESRDRGFPMTLRGVVTLIKLIKASAVLHRRENAKTEDLNLAIEILDYTYRKILQSCCNYNSHEKKKKWRKRNI